MNGTQIVFAYCHLSLAGLDSFLADTTLNPLGFRLNAFRHASPPNMAVCTERYGNIVVGIISSKIPMTNYVMGEV